MTLRFPARGICILRFSRIMEVHRMELCSSPMVAQASGLRNSLSNMGLSGTCGRALTLRYRPNFQGPNMYFGSYKNLLVFRHLKGSIIRHSPNGEGVMSLFIIRNFLKSSAGNKKKQPTINGKQIASFEFVFSPYCLISYVTDCTSKQAKLDL